MTEYAHPQEYAESRAMPGRCWICNTARRFAMEKHEGQKYGDQPYTVHLDAVHAVAVSAGLPGVVFQKEHATDLKALLVEIREAAAVIAAAVQS